MATEETRSEEAAAIHRAQLRLLPLLALLYFVSFLDRVNVGFAALTMNGDIGLSAREFGFGAGIFFIGYIAFAVPANLILKRIGASRWIAGIAVAWGLVALLMVLVKTPEEFYVVRFLLGVTESGFFPGVILYLTEWFPAHVIGSALGNFFIAVPLSNVVGAPLSTWLLTHGFWGLRGWQSMFLVEAVPSIVLGIVAVFWLDDRPGVASWLTHGEREALASAVSGKANKVPETSLRSGLVNINVWGLGVLYFVIVVALLGFAFWAPQILRGIGRLSVQQTGWATAIPYCAAAAAMYVWSQDSDHRGERTWHVVLPCVASAVGFLIVGHTTSLVIAVLGFMLATAGIYAAWSVFWTMPRYILAGTAAAGGIALINSIGNVAGYFGPVVLGRLKASTGGYAAGIYMMAACMMIAGALALVLSVRVFGTTTRHYQA